MPMLSQDMGPHALGPALSQVHVIITHCNLHTATHSTVSPLHTYGQCERVSCVCLEKYLPSPLRSFAVLIAAVCTRILSMPSGGTFYLHSGIASVDFSPQQKARVHTHTANFSQKHLEQLILSNFTLWEYILGFLNFPLPENKLKVIPSFLDI